ncbi:MAG: hypothetical protein ACON4R_12345 [Akkermansiaceae bacterium]
MTSREKILLGLCAVGAVGVALFYGIDILEVKRQSSIKPKDYSSVITQAQLSLKTGQLTAYEQATLKAAGANWPRNPMGQKVVKVEVKNDRIKCPPYTGFVQVGEVRSAIIGGDDYRVGQIIKGGEFRLITISPSSIEVLLNGANETLEVPIEKKR